MSDVVDGSGGVPRRSPRGSDGGAPVSGALAMGLAAVAVVAGFFILRSITDNGDRQLDVLNAGTSGATENVASASTTTPTSSLAPVTPVVTEPQVVTEGATVIVANASRISGSASQMTRALTAAGFTLGEATNAAGQDEALTTSIIYFDELQAPVSQQVAESLNTVLGGGATVLALPAGTPPVEDGSLDGAGVLLLLGTDKANKTLDELNPAGAGAGTQTSVITNPVLPGSSTVAPSG